MPAKFVHLRVHTEFSLVDGIVRVKPLVNRVRELGMPAVAVTDHSNLFALVKFYRASQSAGIKPIIGADVCIQHGDSSLTPFRMTLLVQNETGYKTLTELLSRAYLEGQHQGNAVLSGDWLKAHNTGLIALSGAREGDLGQTLLRKNDGNPEQVLEHWMRIFDSRFYVEVQRTGRPGDERYLDEAIRLAAQFNAPVVATNDVRFLHRDEFAAHEARLCIFQGRILDDPRRPRDYSDSQYLKSGAEMDSMFSDLPEALKNTVEVARRCNLSLSLGQNFLPDFPVPGGKPLQPYFVEQAHQGLRKRLSGLTEIQPDKAADPLVNQYWERLDTELKVIAEMGFAGYFLIVADFIRWAKNNGIPVGPGRGSGAGSLVAYALEITDIDPIEFDLLFERFLNPERVSMPDFDVDFCMERRDRVIDYVAEKYGRDRVSQIITYGSMAARAVVRDVGRVLGHPYGFVDKLAKLIPFELGMTLEKALKDSEDLQQTYSSDEEVKTLIDLARCLEGITRNPGKHAGGVVIAPSKLTDFTPLFCEPGGENLVTQFDKDDVEAVGLVKFDFLGLRTLTIIDWAVQTINTKLKERNENTCDITRIPRDDPETYKLLSRCATTAVFQLESRGMKDLVKRLQPDCFEDIVALVALFRPGPLQSGMVDDYIDVKHGKARAEYAHPVLEPILKPTNGVILYQEQVMQIARELAGYTLGAADLLRRAMGKKKPEEMAQQRSIFNEGAVARGVDPDTANRIFDLMEKFAGYGFNKSHSAAYALVAYQTAWLKTHYPAEFMAAVLSADMDNTDKVVTLIDECREMGLEIQPPNINRSEFQFVASLTNSVVYGLGAIKGVGRSAIEEVLKERTENNDFQNLQDFCQRMDSRKVNRRVMEATIQAGAFDEFGEDRAQLMADLPVALKTAEQRGKTHRLGQGDLFGFDVATDLHQGVTSGVKVEPWPEERRLAAEKATLGLYLTGHPISQYEKELPYFTHGRLSVLATDAQRLVGRANIRLAGLIVELRMRRSRTGKPMAFLTLDDRTGRAEVAVFGETYQQFRDLLAKDNLLVAEGDLGIDEYSGNLRLTAARLFSIEQIRSLFATNLVIDWPQATAQNDKAVSLELIAQLQNLITPFQGGDCPVCIDYVANSARGRIRLDDCWNVHPRDECLRLLEKTLGTDRIKVEYRHSANH